MAILFIQFGLASCFLLISLFLTWYVGMITAVHEKGGYSTPVSSILNGHISHNYDNSQLNYFFYAVKFHPIYPAIMTISVFYLVILIGFALFKNNSVWLASYLAVFGILLIALSYFVLKPLAVKDVFSQLFLAGGLVFILMAKLSFFDVFQD